MIKMQAQFCMLSLRFYVNFCLATVGAAFLCVASAAHFLLYGGRRNEKNQTDIGNFNGGNIDYWHGSACRTDAEIKVTVTDEYGNTVTDTCTVTVKHTFIQIIIIVVLFGWIWY